MSEGPSKRQEVAGLGQRSAQAFGWGALSSVVKVLFTVVVQGVLARLLGPSEFGLFALGIVVMGVAGYFADMGVATSLVQRKAVADDDVRFVFTWNLVTASAVAALVVVAAPWLASLFNKPELRWVFVGMAPVFVLNAAAAVSVSLLRRELDNRSIQWAGLLGYVFGFGVVGVAVAALGGSTLSLVAAYCAQSLLTLVLMYRRTRHVLGLRFTHPDRQGFFGFGGTVLLTNLVNWAASAVDRVVIGRLFSAGVVGSYSAAYNLVYAPVGALYPNLQSTVFASLARMQGDLPRMADAYLALLRAVATVFVPGFVGVFCVASALVEAVYGPQWAQAGELAAAFCLMAPFLMLWACSTPVLWNTGRKSWEWRIQLPMVGVACAAVALTAGISILAVAWAAATVYMLRTVLVMLLAARLLAIPLQRLLLQLWPAAWMSGVVAVVVSALAGAVRSHATAAPLELVVGLAATAAALLACLLLVPASLPPLARAPLARLGERLPRWLRPLLMRLGGEAT